MNWQITSTATVIGDPRVSDENITIAATASKMVQNPSGEVQKSTLLFFINYGGRRLADLTPRLVKGTRIAFEGYFLGNNYGNPIIFETKDQKPYTAFSIEATDVRVIGVAPKKANENGFEDLTTVILIGHLGRDPELRFTPAGDMVCQTSIAINTRNLNEANEWVSSTVWFRLNIWRDAADRANKWWKKGTKLVVRLGLTADQDTGAPRLWEAQDGSTRASYEGTVYTWEFATPKGAGDSNDAPLPAEERNVEDEIPF